MYLPFDIEGSVAIFSDNGENSDSISFQLF